MTDAAQERERIAAILGDFAVAMLRWFGDEDGLREQPLVLDTADRILALLGAAPAERGEAIEDAMQYLDAIVNGFCGNPLCGCCDTDAGLARNARRALAAAPREQPEPETAADRMEREVFGPRRTPEPPAPGETRERPKCARCGKQSDTPGDWAECFTVCDECWPAQLGPQDAARFAPTGEAARLANVLEEVAASARLQQERGEAAYLFRTEIRDIDAAARLLRGERASEDGGA